MNMREFVETRNPVSKGVFSLALLIIGLIVPFPHGFALLAFILLVSAAGGDLRGFLKVFLRSLFILAIMIVVMRGFFTFGETVLFSFWIFDFTVEGVLAGGRMAQTLVLGGSAILLFFNITDIKRLTIALEQKGVSTRTTFVILSSFQMISELSRLSGTIMEAQRSRGIETEGSLWVRAKAYIPLVGPLIISSIAHLEERVITLESRAFSAPTQKTRIQAVEESPADRAISRLSLVLLVLVIAWRITVWL